LASGAGAECRRQGHLALRLALPFTLSRGSGLHGDDLPLELQFFVANADYNDCDGFSGDPVLPGGRKAMSIARSAFGAAGQGWARFLAAVAMGATLCGCHCFPFSGTVETNGKFKVETTNFPDFGPMVARVVRCGRGGPGAGRIAIVDVDGLIVNQNMTGLSSAGDNPVAAFREKLEAVAADASVRAVVLRINSPGGGVAASEIMGEELWRFRLATAKPVVACLMDLATGGAYYLAVGADCIVAQPSGITGCVGAIVNCYDLSDSMELIHINPDAIKSGAKVDMGSVMRTVHDDERALFQEVVNGHASQFQARVAQLRPAMTGADSLAIKDGRILSASRALELHMVDGLGFLDDAIAEAERRTGLFGAEVVLVQRSNLPIRSMYAIAPNMPLQSAMVPFSMPGLDRSKLPTFLYLWQPDPTLTRVPPP
jgi:protease-4